MKNENCNDLNKESFLNRSIQSDKEEEISQNTDNFNSNIEDVNILRVNNENDIKLYSEKDR